MSKTEEYEHLVRRDRIVNEEQTFSHPWNEKSGITGTHLSRLGGLERTGVSLVRIAPGKESFAYHLHHREEEWIYVLSGRGVAHIDGRDHDIAAGDFVAFPTPSVAHQTINPHDEDLVYLMGGESRRFEIADFPSLDRRMIRTGDTTRVYALSEGEPFGEAED